MRLWFTFSLSSGSKGIAFARGARNILQSLRDVQRNLPTSAESVNRVPGGVLWRSASAMEDYGTNWVPHRVLRWNEHSVVVEAQPWGSGAQLQRQTGKRGIRSYWLNRRDLEQFGVARVRTRKIAFFTNENSSSEAVALVESLIRLGLWFPYTEDDLRQAYFRLALAVHPDVGGNEEKFLQLESDRELAAAALERLTANSATPPRDDRS
jgi:hypothetical protein